MEALFHKEFKKNYGKLPRLQDQVDSRLDLSLKDPFDLSLSNHPLQGEWTGYRSINITGDYRAIYREVKKNVALFVALGTHGQLYR